MGTTSIIQRDKECLICQKHNAIEEHHLFGGSRRKKSEMYGLKVYLCSEHHRGTKGVHGKWGQPMQLKLHMIGQHFWMEHYNKTEDEFIEKFGRSYL